jgi:hypothetical protein
MQSVAEQRRAVRLLQLQGQQALDRAFAGLPEQWEAIVLKHAERQKDGTLRITERAKGKILAECAADLVKLEPPIAAVVGQAVKRARQLPGEALTG